MSTPQWFAEFERDEARRQDRLDQIRANMQARDEREAETIAHDWPGALAAHEAEIVSDDMRGQNLGAASDGALIGNRLALGDSNAAVSVAPRSSDQPPFPRGARVVRHAAPQQGSVIVGECRWLAGGWRVYYARPSEDGAFVEGSAVAADFVLAPPAWAEPPCPFRGEYHDLRGQVPSASEAEKADWLMAAIMWWQHVGTLVAPDLAEREIEAARRLAAMLGEEAGL